MSDVLKEMRDSLDELIRMHQLNFELLEELNVACKWLLENRIEVPNRGKLVLLLNKADALLNEIYSEPPFLQHRKRTPNKDTEPAFRFW